MPILILISVAHAGILELDENKIEDGFITQDNVTYRILDDRVFTIKYLNNGFAEYRRIIVENFDEVQDLEERISNVFGKVSQLDQQVDELKNQIAGMEGEKTELLAELKALEEERDIYKSELDELEAKRNELENTLTGNFLVSPQAYQVGLAIFVIILVATIIIKTRQYTMK
jgi:chromosome segregation ATPase